MQTWKHGGKSVSSTTVEHVKAFGPLLRHKWLISGFTPLRRLFERPSKTHPHEYLPKFNTGAMRVDHQEMCLKDHLQNATLEVKWGLDYGFINERELGGGAGWGDEWLKILHVSL